MIVLMEKDVDIPDAPPVMSIILFCSGNSMGSIMSGDALINNLG